MLQTKKLTKSCGTVVKPIFYELGAINLYLEGAAITVSTICYISVSTPAQILDKSNDGVSN